MELLHIRKLQILSNISTNHMLQIASFDTIWFEKGCKWKFSGKEFSQCYSNLHSPPLFNLKSGQCNTFVVFIKTETHKMFTHLVPHIIKKCIVNTNYQGRNILLFKALVKHKINPCLLYPFVVLLFLVLLLNNSGTLIPSRRSVFGVSLLPFSFK